MEDILKILEQTCDIVCENIPALSPDEFAMIRRNGLGASDSDVILGLKSNWKNIPDILEEKNQTEVTEAEREIGKKVVVRLGIATESLNLTLASEYLEQTVHKLPHMFRLKKFPFLTINYDGLMIKDSKLIPIEAKYISMYGARYYDFKKSNQDYFIPPETLTTVDVVKHCEEAAVAYGIPSYYYAQIQQQLMALPDTTYGYLSGINSKANEHHMFQIPADKYVQNMIAIEGNRVWKMIESYRK